MYLQLLGLYACLCVMPTGVRGKDPSKTLLTQWPMVFAHDAATSYLKGGLLHQVFTTIPRVLLAFLHSSSRQKWTLYNCIRSMTGRRRSKMVDSPECSTVARGALTCGRCVLLTFLTLSRSTMAPCTSRKTLEMPWTKWYVEWNTRSFNCFDENNHEFHSDHTSDQYNVVPFVYIPSLTIAISSTILILTN